MRPGFPQHSQVIGYTSNTVLKPAGRAGGKLIDAKTTRSNFNKNTIFSLVTKIFANGFPAWRQTIRILSDDCGQWVAGIGTYDTRERNRQN